MRIYEISINDKKNEGRTFWCTTAEEAQGVIREQIELGAKDAGIEIHYMPMQLFATALPVLKARYDKQNNPTHKTPTRSFNNDSIETQYSKIIIRIRKAILTCLVLLLLTAIVPCPKHTYAEENDNGNRWTRLNRKAKELYGGYDVTVKVKAGLPIPVPFIQDTDDSQNPFSSVSQGSGNGLFGKILLEIPLYSKDIRRKKESDKRKFLQDGYNYIKIINEGTGALDILKEKSMVLKAVMKDEGISSISAYYDALTEMVKLENEILEAGRNFETMVSR